MCELADGSEIQMDITVPQVELWGSSSVATNVFGEPDTKTLLGMTALESLGIEVDLGSQDAKASASGTVEAGWTTERTAPAYKTLTMEIDYRAQLQT